MWMLEALVVALILGLVTRIPVRTARLALVPFVVGLVALQGLKYGLF